MVWAMNGETRVSLEQVFALAQQLPLLDKVRLIARMALEIERDMLAQRPGGLKSLLGLCADLGPAPSAEDIEEIRREMWGGFEG